MVVLGLDRVTIYPAYGVSWLPEAYEFATDYTEDDAAVGQMQFADIDALVASSYATFSRASAGVAETSTGELVNFAANEPRITDRGILIEGAATNVLTKSRTFTDSAWLGRFEKPTFTGGVSDPFGGTGAYRFNATDVTGGVDSSRGGIFIQDATAFADGDDVTTSIWMRASAPIDVTHGITDGQQQVSTLTTEWKRYTYTGSYDSVTARTFQLFVISNDDIDIDIYGAQSEAGLYASSYIDSDSGSATTRPADELTLTLESAITSGLFLAEFEAGNGWGVDSVYRRIFQVENNGTYRAWISSSENASSTVRMRINDDSAVALLGAVNLGVLSGTVRAALRVQSGNHGAFATGLPSVLNSNTGVTTMDGIRVGWGGEKGNTYIKSIALVDPNEWTDTEIQNWVDSV